MYAHNEREAGQSGKFFVCIPKDKADLFIISAQRGKQAKPLSSCLQTGIQCVNGFPPDRRSVYSDPVEGRE